MSSISEWVKNRRERDRDREARKESKREQLSEQRRVFQRETLLALQEATFDVIRTTGAAHHQDEMAYRTTGQWQKQLLGEDLDQKASLAMRRTSILGLRVRDPSLRQLVQEFKQHAAQTTVGGGRDACTSAMHSTATVFEKMQEQVGELLRTLDDEETAI